MNHPIEVLDIASKVPSLRFEIFLSYTQLSRSRSVSIDDYKFLAIEGLAMKFYGHVARRMPDAFQQTDETTGARLSVECVAMTRNEFLQTLEKAYIAGALRDRTDVAD